VQPHKVRYYLERRDEAFEQKMAEVLCVYREVAVLRERSLSGNLCEGHNEASDGGAGVRYDDSQRAD
jgi:hypothetical protein